MKQYLTKTHLVERLRDEGLPCTHPTIIKYEKKGIIPRPQNRAMFEQRNWRLYTASEVEAIVKAIRKYISKSKIVR